MGGALISSSAHVNLSPAPCQQTTKRLKTNCRWSQCVWPGSHLITTKANLPVLRRPKWTSDKRPGQKEKHGANPRWFTVISPGQCLQLQCSFRSAVALIVANYVNLLEELFVCLLSTRSKTWPRKREKLQTCGPPTAPAKFGQQTSASLLRRESV